MTFALGVQRCSNLAGTKAQRSSPPSELPGIALSSACSLARLAEHRTRKHPPAAVVTQPGTWSLGSPQPYWTRPVKLAHLHTASPLTPTVFTNTSSKFSVTHRKHNVVLWLRCHAAEGQGSSHIGFGLQQFQRCIRRPEWHRRRW